MKMFMKMLNWRIGIHHQFNVTTGISNKYLKRFLSEAEMKRLQNIFPNGEYGYICNKLFLMYDYFHELESEVAIYFNFTCDKNETKKVKDFLAKKRLEKNSILR